MSLDPQAATTEAISVTLELSQEELAVLLRVQGIPRLPGFTIPATFTDAHAEAALNSLRARRVLGIDVDQQVYVLPAAEVLVQAGNKAARVLSIARYEEGRSPILSWYYFTPEVTVFHSAYDVAVHHFQSIPHGMSWLATLALAMGIDPLLGDQPSSERFSLAPELWKQVAAGLRRDQPDQAADVLKRSRMSARFVDAVLHSQLKCTVNFLQAMHGNQVSSNGLLLLNHNSSNWLLRFGPERIEVSAVSNKEALESVAGLMVEGI